MALHHGNIWTFVAVLSLAFSTNILHVHGRWVNGFNRPISFTCGSREFVRTIASRHHNGYEDRMFFLTCGKLPSNLPRSTPTCSLSGFVNEFDEAVSYRCGGAGYMAGMYSYHHNDYQDRRFKYYCCHADHTKTSGCYDTGYVNTFDDVAAFVVPDGKILKGMISYHDNHKEDRRFKFEVCDISGQ